MTFDYTRKDGVLSVETVGFEGSPADFAKKLDAAENRSNSRVCREAIVALPHQLTQDEMRKLSKSIALAMKDRWGVDSVVALHEPARGGDQRNFHVHIVFSTRDQEGKKTTALDKRDTGPREVEWLREETSKRITAVLRKRMLPAEDWDHRSYARREIPLVPMMHEGPLATKLRRRGKTIETLARAKHNDTVRKERPEQERAMKAYGECRDRIVETARKIIRQGWRRQRFAEQVDAAIERLEQRRRIAEAAEQADRNRRLAIERQRRDRNRERLGESVRRIRPDDPPIGYRV
jgi:hypothetical protein